MSADPYVQSLNGAADSRSVSDLEPASGAFQIHGVRDLARDLLPIVVGDLLFLLTTCAHLESIALAFARGGFLPLVVRFCLGSAPAADAAVVEIVTRDLAP